MADMIFPGTAAPADVLTGKKFSAGTNYDTDGSMANQGSPTFTPTGNAQSLPVGYYSGGTINGVSVKVATGTVTGSGAYTFNLNGSSASNITGYSIPVPSGATKILGVHVLTSNTPTQQESTFATEYGYVDGSTSSVVQQFNNRGTNNTVTSGGSFSCNTSSILLCADNSTSASNYTVYYI